MVAENFIGYLDTISQLEIIRAYKQQSFALMQIKQGDYVLDLGCGPGTDTLVLAEMVGTAGHIVGIDRRPDMIIEAHMRAGGMAAQPDYLVGDAYQLSFNDNTFDSCRTDRVLHTLTDPRRALAEMIRVTRSGGHIVVCEPDWETVIIDTPLKNLTRKILNFLCDTVPSGWVGRQLPRLFKDLGLQNNTTILTSGTLETFAQANQLLHLEKTITQAVGAGIISWVEGIGWLGLLEKADEEGSFFCGMTGLTVYGQKP